ncbi:MAG: nitrous oxide-stimulated promoter family protein [Candidatus Omnitrophota bacterium]
MDKEKDAIIQVMRFAGPRMIAKHPIFAVKH